MSLPVLLVQQQVKWQDVEFGPNAQLRWTSPLLSRCPLPSTTRQNSYWPRQLRSRQYQTRELLLRQMDLRRLYRLTLDLLRKDFTREESFQYLITPLTTAKLFLYSSICHSHLHSHQYLQPSAVHSKPLHILTVSSPN